VLAVPHVPAASTSPPVIPNETPLTPTVPHPRAAGEPAIAPGPASVRHVVPVSELARIVPLPSSARSWLPAAASASGAPPAAAVRGRGERREPEPLIGPDGHGKRAAGARRDEAAVVRHALGRDELPRRGVPRPDEDLPEGRIGRDRHDRPAVSRRGQGGGQGGRWHRRGRGGRVRGRGAAGGEQPRGRHRGRRRQQGPH
jgi:hypothetical protein